MCRTPMEPKGPIVMRRYELGKLLGRGAFAKVYHARNLLSGESVAVKTIDKAAALAAGLGGSIRREISAMRLVVHPHVVRVHEVMASRDRIYVVMEYVRGGELAGRIPRGGMREGDAQRHFRQLVAAVEYCHSRGVCHRDLKLENVLLDERGDVKVTDFGLCALPESRRQDGLLHTTCGTPAYVAPEVIGRAGYDGAKTDAWSCGVVLFALVAGYLPFYGSNVLEVYRKIQCGEFRCPTWFSGKLKRLLHKILDPNPTTRASMHGIRRSSWFRAALGGDALAKLRTTGEKSPPGGGDAAGEVKALEVPSMNAFDLISCFSRGLDLSGLFVEGRCREEARFTSARPAAAIVSKLEDVGRRLKLRVEKKGKGVVRMEGREEGRKGVLQLDAEVFEMAPRHHLVELKKANGDTVEFRKLLEAEVRPALKDIVWAWEDGPLKQQGE